jgi:hypothetical protein
LADVERQLVQHVETQQQKMTAVLALLRCQGWSGHSASDGLRGRPRSRASWTNIGAPERRFGAGTGQAGRREQPTVLSSA